MRLPAAHTWSFSFVLFYIVLSRLGSFVPLSLLRIFLFPLSSSHLKREAECLQLQDIIFHTRPLAGQISSCGASPSYFISMSRVMLSRTGYGPKRITLLAYLRPIYSPSLPTTPAPTSPPTLCKGHSRPLGSVLRAHPLRYGELDLRMLGGWPK